MKRILMLLSLLILVLALSVSAAATEVVVAEDLQTAQIGEDTYIRANISLLGSSYYEAEHYTVTVPQTEQFSSVTASLLQDNTGALRLSFSYADGSSMTVTYIREDLLPVYEQLTVSQDYTVDFYFPVDNKVNTTKSALMGELVGVPALRVDGMEKYNVYAIDSDSGMKILRGELFEMDDAFFYVDLMENGITDPSKITFKSTQVICYKVTDAALVEELNGALDNYYGTEFSWLEDEALSERLTIILMAIAFGLLPLAALVVFTIFAIRSKKKVYRILCITVCGWAVLILATLTLLLLMF